MHSATAIIRCPARNLEHMRLLPVDKRLFVQERMLLLSFAVHNKRATAESASYRNFCMTALAEKIFITYGAPGSKTESLCRQIMQWGKRVYTFNDPNKVLLLSMGARPSQMKDCLSMLNG